MSGLVCNEGPIFSKATLKSIWLIEHENPSKVSKYVGKFYQSNSLNFFRILQISWIFLQEKSRNLAEKLGLCAIYILKRPLKKYDLNVKPLFDHMFICSYEVMLGDQVLHPALLQNFIFVHFIFFPFSLICL